MDTNESMHTQVQELGEQDSQDRMDTNESMHTQVRYQGCVRKGPHTREDTLLKFANMFGKVVELVNFNSVRVMELQAHAGVTQSLRHAQHTRVMAETQMLRQEAESVMAEIQRFSGHHAQWPPCAAPATVAGTPQTPETPQQPPETPQTPPPQTPETPLQPPLATQKAPHRRKKGSATGSHQCWPGCANCFQSE